MIILAKEHRVEAGCGQYRGFTVDGDEVSLMVFGKVFSCGEGVPCLISFKPETKKIIGDGQLTPLVYHYTTLDAVIIAFGASGDQEDMDFLYTMEIGNGKLL